MTSKKFALIGYVTIKYLKHVKINSLNPLYINFSKVIGYLEESNKNKYLALVPTNKSKEIIKKYEEQWSKIRYLIRLIINNSYDYDEKCMEIKFNSDKELPLIKTIENRNVTIILRAAFHENNKYHPQVFLDECLYEL